MKGLPFVIEFTDASLPGKDKFVITPSTTDGPDFPTSSVLDILAKHQHTSLILPGMGIAEYGIRITEDLVFLLEHFAGSKAPVNPTIGQEWYSYTVDADTAVMKVWDGNGWVVAGGEKTIATYLDYNALATLVNGILTAPAIEPPTNILPAANAIDVDPSVMFKGSDYSSRYNLLQASAQFQISTNSTFTAPLAFDVTKQGPSQTLTLDNPLAAKGVYYWRVRYKDTQGASSAWSAGTKFTVANASLNAPTIVVPTNGATGQAVELQLTSSPISANNGSDTVASADWEIYSGPNATGTKLVGRTGNPGLSFVVSPNVLSRGKTYYARVRLHGTTLGISPWSADCAFTTLAATVDTPSITSPQNNSQITTTPTFVGSNLSITGGTDTLMLASWEIYSGNNGTGALVYSANTTASKQLTLQTGTLGLNAAYSVRVRYTATALGQSAWSAFLNFTTQSATAGTILSYYCNGTTYIATKSDGTGGSYDEIVATNSPQCGYVPPQGGNVPAGTIIATHCVGVDKYNTVANGSGGSTEVLVEHNSTDCGYSPITYPPAGTVLSSRCSGTTKYNTVADGHGGSSESIAETNSTYCGYVPIPPGLYPTFGQMSTANIQGWSAFSRGTNPSSVCTITIKSDGTFYMSAVGAVQAQGYNAQGTLGTSIIASGYWLAGDNGMITAPIPGVGANFDIQFGGKTVTYDGTGGASLATTVGSFNTWLNVASDRTITVTGKYVKNGDNISIGFKMMGRAKNVTNSNNWTQVDGAIGAVGLTPGS